MVLNSMKTKRQAGFTLAELLVSLSIIVLLVSGAVYGFQSYGRYQEYEQAVAGIIGTIQQARVEARAADSDGAYGVHLEANRIVTYVGSTYTAGAASNQVYSFKNVTLTPALTGSATNIIFEPLTGRPNVSGTISLAGSLHLATTTVTISGGGVIQ